MRISDWSSDVCSSDLQKHHRAEVVGIVFEHLLEHQLGARRIVGAEIQNGQVGAGVGRAGTQLQRLPEGRTTLGVVAAGRSEERSVEKECVSTCRSRWSP